MGSYIHSISYFLPEGVIDNKKLSEEFPEWDADKIFEKVGPGEYNLVGAQQSLLTVN